LRFSTSNQDLIYGSLDKNLIQRENVGFLAMVRFDNRTSVIITSFCGVWFATFRECASAISAALGFSLPKFRRDS